MKKILLLSFVIFSCSSNTSDKEKELLRREKEVLEKENQLLKEQTKKSETVKPKSESLELTGSGDITTGPADYNNIEEKIKTDLLGMEISKGLRSWTFVSLSEYEEVNILKHENNFFVVAMVLKDYNSNKRFYAKVSFFYAPNGNIDFLKAIELKRL